MDFLKDFFIRLKNIPTWAMKISLYMTPTNLLLHTLKESLV